MRGKEVVRAGTVGAQFEVKGSLVTWTVCVSTQISVTLGVGIVGAIWTCLFVYLSRKINGDVK